MIIQSWVRTVYTNHGVLMMPGGDAALTCLLSDVRRGSAPAGVADDPLLIGDVGDEAWLLWRGVVLLGVDDIWGGENVNTVGEASNETLLWVTAKLWWGVCTAAEYPIRWWKNREREKERKSKVSVSLKKIIVCNRLDPNHFRYTNSWISSLRAD